MWWKLWAEKEKRNSPCKLEGSRVASGCKLQKSSALPIFGFMERPLLAHSDISFHPGTELKFPLASGNTVSPPSSTSDLHRHKENKKRSHLLASFKENNIKNHHPWSIRVLVKYLQIHKKGSSALTPVFSVKLINKVIIVRLVLLTHFIAQNLETFSVLCK